MTNEVSFTITTDTGKKYVKVGEAFRWVGKASSYGWVTLESYEENGWSVLATPQETAGDGSFDFFAAFNLFTAACRTHQLRVYFENPLGGSAYSSEVSLPVAFTTRISLTVNWNIRPALGRGHLNPA